MEDLIGFYKSRQLINPPMGFYHSVLWTSSMPTLPLDSLSFWVTYIGWADPSNDRGSGNLSVGSEIIFYSDSF